MENNGKYHLKLGCRGTLTLGNLHMRKHGDFQQVTKQKHGIIADLRLESWSRTRSVGFMLDRVELVSKLTHITRELRVCRVHVQS